MIILKLFSLFLLNTCTEEVTTNNQSVLAVKNYDVLYKLVMMKNRKV